jgi:ATP phosphoribosyltransferase regulatory subunit
MADKGAILAEALRLRAAFEALGAEVAEADILQPAETLLDLYGEEIRARAYVTHDPARGEAMLRPDFTVPIVQMHMDGEGGAKRYTYMGEVFRKQEDDRARASEYIQVGYEVFNGADAAEADAEVFAAFARLLAPLKLRAATGDIGLLTAAVKGLSTSDRRKEALLRHLWRPHRFRALMERFGGRTPLPPSRRALIEAADPLAHAAPEIGLRTRAEVLDRIAALKADAMDPPIPAAEIELLQDLLSLRETPPNALAHLRNLAVDLPALTPAVNRFEARLEAMTAQGIDVDTLDFEASYGRTSMEYYDGFVFGFYADGRPNLPPVATGGRYDALTRVLGHGRELPAVGGVIRPALVLDLGGAT